MNLTVLVLIFCIFLFIDYKFHKTHRDCRSKFETNTKDNTSL